MEVMIKISVTISIMPTLKLVYERAVMVSICQCVERPLCRHGIGC